MNLLCLLLLGTEHRWCEDPIESALFIIIIIIIIFILLLKPNRIFEGLNMLEKSRNLYTPQNRRKLTSDICFRSGCGKWLDSATYTLSPECASSYVSRTCINSRYTHVTHQYLQKSLLEQNPKSNRKSVIFNFLCKFLCHFDNFMCHTLTNSS